MQKRLINTWRTLLTDVSRCFFRRWWGDNPGVFGGVLLLLQKLVVGARPSLFPPTPPTASVPHLETWTSWSDRKRFNSWKVGRCAGSWDQHWKNIPSSVKIQFWVHFRNLYIKVRTKNKMSSCVCYSPGAWLHKVRSDIPEEGRDAHHFRVDQSLQNSLLPAIERV